MRKKEYQKEKGGAKKKSRKRSTEATRSEEGIILGRGNRGKREVWKLRS